MTDWRRYLPVLLVLVALVLLGYPLALLFGLPLAVRDMNDLRKWEHATVSARPLAEIDDDLLLEFPEAAEGGLLVRDDVPLDWEYRVSEEGVRLAEVPPEGLITWAGELEPLGSGLYRLPEGVDAADPTLAIYAGDRLLSGTTVGAREVPEGVRETFSFPDAQGPVIVGGEVLVEGEEYEDLGDRVQFSSAPPFGSDIRRVRGDYGVVDAGEGLIVLSGDPAGPVRVAASVVRLAEVLEPVEDPEGRRYRFASGRVVETDRERRVFVGNELLSDADERPQERVDGVRREFTFDSPQGIVTLDGRRQAEGAEYERDGSTVTFAEPPPRNARLRQYPNYFLADPRAGEIELAVAPGPGELVWTSRYTVYSRPSCGTSALECFYALPQHPVPFPHWIAQNVGPFFTQYPLGDERNVVRATLYTTLGTVAALLLGSAVGIVLAVLFVLLRPLEQALLPWVVASQTVPIIALVPVLLLILGNFGITIQTSLLPTAIIGAYIAFFPMVVGTVKGLRSVDPLALDLMRSYAATPLQVFAKVRFPAAVPFFFTSLKLATAAALVGALVAETESNNRRGLGFQILGQVQSGDVADVWILLIVSALLGVGLVALIGGLQRLVAPWERT